MEVARQQSTERDSSEAGTELAHHIARVLSAENQRLQEKIAHYDSLEQPADEAEERLDTARNELMQLGQRLDSYSESC